MAGGGENHTPKQPGGRTSQPVPRVPVSDLMGAGREAVLVHDGFDYRLRLTSNGKLILTK
jgi:hemin uptake protein HemP